MLASTQQVAPTQIPATNVHALGPIHRISLWYLRIIKAKGNAC